MKNIKQLRGLNKMNQASKNKLLNKHAIRVFSLRCNLDREIKSSEWIDRAISIENKIEATKHKMDLIRGLT